VSGAMAWIDQVPAAIAVLFCVVGIVALWFSDFKGGSHVRRR
jgi:hypothetical protein